MLAFLLAAAAATAQTVPTDYQAGHFYATPRTADGQALRLLVDTGGGGAAGMYWITAKAAERLRLATSPCEADASLHVVPAPTFAAGQSLPPPDGPCGASVMVNKLPYDLDGQLGAAYLGTRTWTFDYPARRLIAAGEGWKPAAGAHSAPLGFRRSTGPGLDLYFPRIVARIDGQPIDFLLDTGATAHPTAAGKQASGTETVHGEGVTSYITTGQLERWHAAHPDWRVIENGDDLGGPGHPSRLIEVPALAIAGWRVGPVWFTERPDSAFHQYMAQMMDRPTEGALGGNVFRSFRMTLDYPKATAWFVCVRDCQAARPSEPQRSPGR
ncbi:hypothetical protein [Dyella sp.]|uniref:hypothetical protein n=1 Tax=Dyella sp. TaxID=1869338 RepID=UPI002D7A0D62|nr:hypothetical protein [Dyella sp.]HET6432762.1 hypothetical protein [Dyella sp.]